MVFGIALAGVSGLWAPYAQAEPVITTTDDGVIDWTRREVRANGVGTPRVISPTGGLTPREPYAVARADAERRISALLARLPIEGKTRLRGVAALTEARKSAARSYSSSSAKHFSDGTVHLPVSASFAWVAESWPGEAEGRASDQEEPPTAPPVVGPPMPGSTGLLIRVAGPVRPAVRLTLTGKAGTARAGTVADALAPGGVIWARGASAEAYAEHIGNAPRVVEARGGADAGHLILADADADLLEAATVAGGVLVLLPPEKTE